MISGKRIFISPLDWGLGHATRCVPIIEALSQNNQVIIGVTTLTADFFNRHFPDLQKAELPSYNISYSKYLPLWLKLLLQWPGIRAVIKREKAELEKIITQQNIDLVISDNRFGLSTKKVECIFITHQLNIKTPFSSGRINVINRRYINEFSEVWVPDYEDQDRRLSGELSHPGDLKIPVKFIGPQSALIHSAVVNVRREKIDFLVLLSGVEPQRSSLEKLLLEKFKDTKKKVVFVRGSSSQIDLKGSKVQVVDFAYGKELRELIVNSETVICRSGYSSLMDLHLLGKTKLILIPTPGQSEQEYLADYWKSKLGALTLLQAAIKSHIFR